MTLARDLWSWWWRLLPANPIMVRVVSAGGKRTRHLWARIAYLVVLFLVMLVMGTGLLDPKGNSLAALAKQSTTTFMFVSLVQLFLMSFIAPVFTASAITQEKDSNTFDILLTTPLSTGQVVLGTLFSRLFFVWALLLSGLPIFCITMIYGGVTTAEVFQSFGLAACTGLVTGALAILISVVRMGTRRTIFSFFLGVAVYLLAVGAFGRTAYGALSVAPMGTGMWGAQMSWLAPLHPFLALLAVTGQTPPPSPEAVYAYGWPWRWLLVQPAYGYMVLTALASGVMIALSLFFVRAGQKEGEPTLWNRIRGSVIRSAPAGERSHEPRRVWNNPIAWREANTRGSAAGASATRWLFIIGGALGAIVLLAGHLNGWWMFNASNPAIVRKWLVAVVMIEMAVILLIVTNVAATTLTREKESLTIELLLTTPLTSKYIVAGMLRGLVSFVIPMIAVPTFTVLLFVISDLRQPAASRVTTPEALVMVPPLMTAFVALAAMIGLNFSLNSKKTIQAVSVSTVVVMFASGLLWGCALALAQGGVTMAAVVWPFTPFPAISALIDYGSMDVSYNQGANPAELLTARATRFIMSIIAIIVYAGITRVIYSHMVRNFDMTVRRQSA